MNPHHAPAKLLKTTEVARLFGVHHQTIKRWVQRGWLTCIRTPGQRMRFDAAQVQEKLREHREWGRILDA